MAIYRAGFVMQFSLKLPNHQTRAGAEDCAKQFADLPAEALIQHVRDGDGEISCAVATVDLDPTSTRAYRKAAQVTTLINRKLSSLVDGPELSQAAVTDVLRAAELLPCGDV